jgi:hypothetical protein
MKKITPFIIELGKRFKEIIDLPNNESERNNENSNIDLDKNDNNKDNIVRRYKIDYIFYLYFNSNLIYNFHYKYH